MMAKNYIKSILINGFKKFQNFKIDFNASRNIFVGENEAGKSTILDAIKLVLNQDYRHADKAVLSDLFNVDMVKSFKEHPSLENLPKIYIEVEFELDSKSKNAECFFGEHNCSKNGKYGISFTCELNDELKDDVVLSTEAAEVPYEYYTLRWVTFSGMAYNLLKKPLKFLCLNTSEQGRYSSFNYYTKTVFDDLLENSEKIKLKNNFRTALKKDFNAEPFPKMDNRTFGIDNKKIILENILSIFDKDVALENHGSGMESLIKTEIALNSGDGFDVILMEEPENHLSFTNMQRMLQLVTGKNETSQLIIATHSSMIASRLDLRNVFWITKEKAHSLNNVPADVANFFSKAVNNNFLQLLLSTKVILVEGPTEFLLVPEFYEQLTQRTMSDDQVTIISCNGISYKKYLQIAENTHKRIAVITDNDKNTNNQIENSEADNTKYQEQQEYFSIFMDSDSEKWTWEVCLYESNKEKIEEILNPLIDKKAKYKYHDQDYGPYLGYMLNHKADFAFKILEDGLIKNGNIKAPEYVKEAIKWVSE